MPTDDLDHLKTLDGQKLQELAQRFQEACQGQGSVDLAAFLPPAGDPLRLSILHELIFADMKQRWQQGQAIGLEYYLEKFPELGPARALPPDLIYQEYDLRQRHGDKPALAIYRKRFPDQFEQLRQRVESEGDATTPTSGPHPTAFAQAPNPTEQVLPVGGGYRLVKRIGSGSFGEVWLAEAPGGLPAAVKIIFRPIDHEEAQRELAALELIRGLRHRCLVQTHAFWSLQDRLYIVMELADGSLRERLQECRKGRQQGIPADELLTYVRDAAEGLDYLHAQHVHHRDVKPENILLLQGHAKVADFGLARVQGSRRMSTATGVGTPMYMAPEVFRGKISPHSDQYGLAMAYGELRLGRRLLAGTNLIELMMEHLERTPDLSPLPAAEKRVLLKALDKDPDRRYPNCMEWVRELEQARAPAVRVSVPDTIPDMGTEKLGPPPPWWRRLVWPCVLVLLLAAGLAGVVAYGRWLAPPREQIRPVASSFSLEAPAALVLTAGRPQTFALHIHRSNFREPVKVSFSGLPPHVLIAETTLPGDADSVEVQASADQAAGALSAQVVVAAEGGDQHQGAVLPLTVLALPLHYDPVGTEIDTDYDQTSYYKRIVSNWPDRSGLVFVLIPRLRKQDPETFYMLADKVPTRIFRRFAQESPGKVRPGWQQDLGDEFPALGMGVAEAYQCARWLGGNLPTTQQWDKAAGFFDRHGRDGPFIGTWPSKAPLDIAINRPKEGPLRLGQARDDVSYFGCRDMAGDGLEWTRTMSDNHSVPLANPPEDAYVYLRGRDYILPEPFQFKDIEDQNTGAWKYAQIDPHTGFRVVIEPAVMADN